jgi:hypothetical protein
MVDDSNADDDAPISLSDEGGDPPFEIGDVVALDPVYFDEDDPALDRRGRVGDVQPAGRGWRAWVSWNDGDQTWVPANQLVDADVDADH